CGPSSVSTVCPGGSRPWRSPRSPGRTAGTCSASRTTSSTTRTSPTPGSTAPSACSSRWPWACRTCCTTTTTSTTTGATATPRAPPGPRGDGPSSPRHSADDQPEPFWRYCLLSFWRVEVTAVLQVVWRHGWRHVVQLAVETLVLAAFWLWMLLADWRFFAFFYLPSYYLGWVLSYAEGYLEHYRCQPGNPYANSASPYHRLYNFLWFNNGYHQEHHWDPKVHWTKMHELHERLRPRLMANHTRMLRGPHMTALIEDWLTARRQKSQPAPEVPERRA